jgi:branched-chain amino acid transport system substrate-binding protein
MIKVGVLPAMIEMGALPAQIEIGALPAPGTDATLRRMAKFTRRTLLAAGACLAAGPARALNNPTAPALAPPVIGAALPLSGELALSGDECLRGVQLAAAAVSAYGGIGGAAVNLIAADEISQSQAAAAVNALIAGNHAAVVLSGGASALSYPSSAAAELAQVPFIELTALADGITARGFKFLLRTGPTATMVAAMAAATIQKRYQNAKIGLLFNSGATGGAIAAAAIAAFKAQKTSPLLVIGYPEDVLDLNDPIGRLKRAGADILLHAAGPSDVLAAFAAMREQDWRPHGIVGCGDGYLLTDSAAVLGGAFDGVLAVGAPFYPPAAAAIEAAYTARYGMPPRGPDSLTAYVGARLVLDTLARQQDSSRLLDALRRTNLPVGSLANGFGVAFARNGQNGGSFVTLQEWRGERLEVVS